MRRLPTKLIIAVMAVGGGYWAAQMLAPLALAPLDPAVELASGSQPASESREVDGSNPPTPGEQASGESGDQLLLQVINRSLERRPNIVAKLRQAVRVDQQRLSGKGQYWQQGIGNLRRTRWELETLVGEDAAYVTQVYDGEYVWTDRRLPGTRKVTRVGLEAIRRSLSDQGAGQGGAAAGDLAELAARGGLSQLMASLARCFTFGPVQPIQAGERTMLAMIGVWRPEQLEKEWPGLSTKSPDEWPSHLPHHVLLYIDSSELFPYLIEYRGGGEADLATDPAGVFATREPLALFELIDVQFFTAVTPANLFQYTPPDPSWHDVTNRVIEELQTPAPLDQAAAQQTGTWR